MPHKAIVLFIAFLGMGGTMVLLFWKRRKQQNANRITSPRTTNSSAQSTQNNSTGNHWTAGFNKLIARRAVSCSTAALFAITKTDNDQIVVNWVDSNSKRALETLIKETTDLFLITQCNHDDVERAVLSFLSDNQFDKKLHPAVCTLIIL